MANHVPMGKPPAVVVTVLDETKFGTKYTELLVENRKHYAEKHGALQSWKVKEEQEEVAAISERRAWRARDQG